MAPLPQPEAWLERDQQQFVLRGNCSLGRAALNTIVLDAPKVSRLHAIVQLEDPGEYWLIDLGSSNGTFLNKRRIREPVRLHDHDQISIGENLFYFRHPSAKSSAELAAARPLVTVQEVENVPLWLLVADIQNFTPLSRSMMSSELALVVSKWLAQCNDIIERFGGVVNKYLGDGILVYWRSSEPITTRKVADAIAALRRLQTGGEPPFRFVVHFGQVGFGGVTSLREETLMGSEVNFAFRLEKLAASLGVTLGLSAAAESRLRPFVNARYAGDFELKGFEGKSAFFAL